MYAGLFLCFHDPPKSDMDHTHKRFKRTLFIGTDTFCKFSGQSPLLSYKTTLKQQLNGKKRGIFGSDFRTLAVIRVSDF